MRSTFKTVFYVNGSKERNGIVPIMGRVTINGTIAQFSCKLSVTKAIWDAKGNRAKGRSKEANEVNFALDNIKAQIAKHYQRLSDREAFVTAEMVRNAYQGIGTEYETLLRAFDKENAAFAQRVGKDRDNVYKGIRPLTGDDIAETVYFAASVPEYMQIAEMLVMPTNQATGTIVSRK